MLKNFLSISNRYELKELNLSLILTITLFFVLLLPFVDSVPHRDGNIEFVEAIDFYNGGFKIFFQNWAHAIHPPFKILLVAFLFKIFGPTSFSYTFCGIVLGMLGIFFFYFLARDIFDKKVASISCFFLAIYPLYVATSIFFLRDFLVTIFSIFTLWLYLRKKEYFYEIFSSLLVLIKETAILLPISIFFVETIDVGEEYFKTRRLHSRTIFHYILKTLPFFVFMIWHLFLKSHKLSFWHAHILSEDSKFGPVGTIIHRLTTFNFLDKFTYQHWAQLFILNFNWVLWFFLVFWLPLIFLRLRHWTKIKEPIKEERIRLKTITASLLFCLFYIFTVLTFPTYTIPRYSLPVIPFLLLGISFEINKIIPNKIKKLMFIIISLILLTALFSSSDPLSKRIWNITELYKEKLYALNYTLAGNDGITYNYQYLLIIKKRTRDIYKIQSGKKILTKNECDLIFPDPNNDYKTFKFLNFDKLWQNELCKLN